MTGDSGKKTPHSQHASRGIGSKWLALGGLGALLVLIFAFSVGRWASPAISRLEAQGQVAASGDNTALGAAQPDSVEQHEPEDLARVEAGRLGQPALIWFGAAW